MPGRKLPYLYLVSTFFFIGLSVKALPPANDGNFVKTEDGVIVYPKVPGVAFVKLQVISGNIIRVTSGPDKTNTEHNSLIVTGAVVSDTVKWSVEQAVGKIMLKTSFLIASADIENGAVSFTDLQGNPIVKERAFNGRQFIPAIYEGEQLYRIKQTFETSPGDAYYGLGQHQDNVFNYHGHQVNLFQNNTEVAIPLLVSDKGYGILWDNYSITSVGDTRPYLPLSSLKLYSATGQRGWLTANYNNNRNKPGNISFTKAESSIDYRYLGDSKLHLPANFKVGTGMITWEGSISSGISGQHVFRFLYGGYLKVWLNGHLCVDRWREAWNPGTMDVDITLEKDKRYPVKIEWIPDGGESYLAADWAPPVPENDVNSYSFSSEAGKMEDYYFINGKNIDEVISGYRDITGKATMLPKWAFGFWQSRERYKTESEILETVDEFRKRQIPIDNIVEDWSYWKQDDWGSQEFDASRFPSPDSMIDVLHKKYHTHFMISVWPKFYEGIPAYKKFNDSGWLYTRNIADSQRDWIAQGYVSTFYDAFNEDARKGFWNLLNDKLYKKGVDAWWMDASEPDILSNVSPAKRKELMTPLALGTSAEYLNAYPLENARGIYEGQRSTDSNKRVFILTRSAFAGQQRYAAATWSGDIGTTWGDMRSQVTAGINFCMSGIPYWTMDIGGFAAQRRFEKPSAADLEEWREQMTRWYQFGAFCPIFRVHGQFPFREIYNTAPDDHPAYKSMLYYDNLRYRLLPYIYSLAGHAYQDNYTIMRGLVMDFSADTAVNNIGDQYMFGPALLINPVYTFHAVSRNMYLPAGQGWYDLYSGAYAAGGQHINAEAPYEKMPVFVKEGSIIPFGPALQYSSEKPADPVTLFVYTGKDASFSLYEDEGTNYNYEKGAFTNIPISYNESSKTLTIGERQGSYSGMLAKRTFNVVWITKDKPVALSFDTKPAATVHYKGNKIIIQYK
ncbi:MAG TPA: TIM-barrel domain-containing protein [Chitinophagaceae bacterium]|nr:TIM-barrel domain-containing protein [Chitinophagaceae bacterium]